MLEDQDLLITGVAFGDADYPRTLQRYIVDITASHGSLRLRRYDSLQVYNITRDGAVNGTEEPFDTLMVTSRVRTFACAC